MSLISVIVPTHNERDNIEPLYTRLKAVFDEMGTHSFELIFCDDSADDTVNVIRSLHGLDARVKLIRLSRRFGQSIAISAGLDYCSGDAVLIMDADLQDPPEVLPQLIDLWTQGNEIVYVQRESTGTYFGYRIMSYLFYRALTKLSSVDMPVDSGEFRLLDRKIVDFLRSLTEHSRYLRGLTVWPGFRSASIRIQRPPRSHGRTNYNFRRSLLVALDGLVGFSIAPLRFVTLLGLIIAITSLLAGVGSIAAKVIYQAPLGAGWMTLLVSIGFLGGLQLTVLGMIGEYIGRIFIEVQNRPLYWVDYDMGFARTPKT